MKFPKLPKKKMIGKNWHVTIGQVSKNLGAGTTTKAQILITRLKKGVPHGAAIITPYLNTEAAVKRYRGIKRVKDIKSIENWVMKAQKKLAPGEGFPFWD